MTLNICELQYIPNFIIIYYFQWKLSLKHQQNNYKHINGIFQSTWTLKLACLAMFNF